LGQLQEEKLSPGKKFKYGQQRQLQVQELLPVDGQLTSGTIYQEEVSISNHLLIYT